MSQMIGDIGSQMMAARSRMQEMEDMYGGGLGGFMRPSGIGRLFGGMPMQRMPTRFSPFGGGGFFGGGFGGFRPRFRRRPRPQMPDFAGQITTLEDKIRQLQEQLAARQTGTPMAPAVPDVMPDDRPPPFLPPSEVTGMEGAGGFAGTMGGMGRVNIPNIDVEQIRKNIEALNLGMKPIDTPIVRPIVNETPPSAPPMRPYVPPAELRPMVDETPTRGGSLAASDMGGRRGKKLVKPIGTERVPVGEQPKGFFNQIKRSAVMPLTPETPMVNLNQMLPPVPVSPPDFSEAGFFRAPEVNVPAPVMNMPAPNLNLGLGKMPMGRIGMR